MCGIYGWQWDPKVDMADWRRAIFAVMLGRFNAKRGDHSWGMFAPELGIRKGLGSIEQVAFKGRKFGTYFAHTRWATTGARTKDNSHPFKIGNIIGCHNGIIYNHEELGKKYNRKYEVDSEHIFHHLNEKLPMGELEGYGTAQWVEADKPHIVYLAKLTGSGDLAVAGTPFGTVWSSDKKHLEETLEIAGLSRKAITMYDVPAGKKHSVEGGKFFIFKDSDLSINARRVDNRTRGYTGYSHYGSAQYGSFYGDMDEYDQPEWVCKLDGFKNQWFYCRNAVCKNNSDQNEVMTVTAITPTATVPSPPPSPGPKPLTQLSLVPSNTTPTSDSPAGAIKEPDDDITVEITEGTVKKMTWERLRELWWGGTREESMTAQVELERRYDEDIKNGKKPKSLVVGGGAF